MAVCTMGSPSCESTFSNGRRQTMHVCVHGPQRGGVASHGLWAFSLMLMSQKTHYCMQLMEHGGLLSSAAGAHDVKS